MSSRTRSRARPSPPRPAEGGAVAPAAAVVPPDEAADAYHDQYAQDHAHAQEYAKGQMAHFPSVPTVYEDYVYPPPAEGHLIAADGMGADGGGGGGGGGYPIGAITCACPSTRACT